MLPWQAGREMDMPLNSQVVRRSTKAELM
jgi:hypothetical protein